LQKTALILQAFFDYLHGSKYGSMSVGTQKRRRVEPCTWIVDSGNEELCVIFGCQLHAPGVFQGWILSIQLAMQVVWSAVESGFPRSWPEVSSNL